VNEDALKSTTLATSPYVRELKTGKHELTLTGTTRPVTTIRDRPRGRALGPCARPTSDLPGHLDPGRPVAGHDERQPRTAARLDVVELGRREGGKEPPH
jgi:hypothetical protein